MKATSTHVKEKIY